MSVRRFVRVEAQGKLVSYVHGGSKIGVLLDVVGGDEQLGKDLAMHIAASKPKALSAAGVPAELLDTERRIAIEKARADNKPEAMLEKIAEGTVQKYLKDVTLLAQVFRQGRRWQADDRAVAESEGRFERPVSRSMSLARGSRSAPTISRPRWQPSSGRRQKLTEAFSP